MKKIFIFIVIALSFSSFAYFDSFDFEMKQSELERKQRELERKQECIEKNQRAQDRYLDCLNNCRMFNSSPCLCMKPMTSLCI